MTAGEREGVRIEADQALARSAGYRVALVVALLLGISLRAVQYFADTSLWLDEVKLARSIVDLPLRVLLTQPLPYDQVAPKGFLLVEKLVVVAFGPSDLALRLFPFVCGILALLLFARVASLVLRGWGPVVATAMFAGAVPLVLFGALVKQYSVDVAVVLLLLLMAVRFEQKSFTGRAAWIAGGIGAAIVWLSQPAVIVAGGLAVVMVFLSFANGEARAARGARGQNVLRMILPWVISSLGAGLAAKATITSRQAEFMGRGWVSGFPPPTMSDYARTLWPLDRLRWLFSEGDAASLAYPAAIVFVLLALFGFSALWRTNKRMMLLIAAPVFASIVAAILRQYPFSERLILYLVPIFLLTTAASVEWMREKLRGISHVLAWAPGFFVLVGALSPIAASPPPYPMEDMKPVLSFLQQKREPEDAIYVFYGAAQAVTYYGNRYGLPYRDYLLGRYHRGASRCYLEEVDTFRSRPRVWVVITHSLDWRGEREDILRYLDTIGVKRLRYSVKSRAVGRRLPPAEVLLYDLSDSTRLARVDAKTFQLAGPSSIDPRVGCRKDPRGAIPPRTR